MLIINEHNNIHGKLKFDLSCNTGFGFYICDK